MPTAEEDRASRRLARCVAHLLRHAPHQVVAALLDRLDEPVRKYLCRDEWLPAAAVTLLLRHGTDADRHYITRNPHVVGRPLPGLPGPARYAARPGPGPELLAEVGPGPFTTDQLTALLRRHGRRPRIPLTLLRMPHDLDPGRLLRAHARTPLPAGAVEALLLAGGLTRAECLALLDARAGQPYGRHWYRPAVRAVRMGLLTCDELVAHTAPAARTLLLGHLPVTSGLRWSLPEQAEMQSAVHRALRPLLGEDPRLWAELPRRAAAFPGTLPELAAALAAGSPAAPGAVRHDPALARAVRHLAPETAPAEPSGAWERELALVSLAVPMDTAAEDVRWVRDCLDRSLLTGADVIRHKVPACWALDEDQWLGDIGHPDRHDRPAAVLAARAEADRLFDAALGDDPQAWWRAARALPDFAGTLPELLARVTDGDSVSKRP
ncbi:hypothetical protein BX286_5278 [Streptomyces sp. 3211.6]|uniref:hypothetical protein n=1 Tax=unclassified Streptomyces TaxID=2593676 RepID=UPI000C2C2171|nr:MULTISPECIES: hypothetical protein [unclassified Streptomyces]RKT07223.1 hypothetical protein BX286_5278 [Streptomyces sp. 3211.6]RPF45170.1 hypothetical protein EDD96_1722 [Streptomyces sp. Ag109_G2-6]